MNRRDTLRTIGIGTVFGASLGTASAETSGEGAEQSKETQNPGRVGRYSGDKTFVPPELGGFDHVLVYLAEPYVEGEWDSAAEAERFQREIMGRSHEEVVSNRREAEAFYEERFGLTFPGEVGLWESEESDDGSAVLTPFYQDPDVGYNAYVVSGRGMPNNHGDGATNRDEMAAGKVRDGGWIVSITEDTTLHGTYGGPEGYQIDAGGMLAFGDYNVKLGDREDPIEIRYESEHPILPLDMPTAFNCDLFHEEWGEGQVRGTTNIPGGSIRNVLTFPPNLE